MATIGLVIKPGIREALSLGFKLMAWASDRGHVVMPDEDTAKLLELQGPAVKANEMPLSADAIVTLGGDGTLIGVARHAEGPKPVFLGVNFGNLGFLTEISPNELVQLLEDSFAGTVQIRERSMLVAEVLRRGSPIFSSKALNDVVVQKGTRDRLLELDLAVEGEDIMRFRADGVIVATPTGSTAYSLAAGGSIVHPSLSVVLITPICAHSLTLRPVILRLDTTITISVPSYEGEVLLMIDGQVSFSLLAGDQVRITKAPHSVSFAKSPSKSYLEILRTKLNWGISNRAT